MVVLDVDPSKVPCALTVVKSSLGTEVLRLELKTRGGCYLR